MGKDQSHEYKNGYFEVFTQKNNATKLFLWAFHGEIIHAGASYPGSWHESKVAMMSGLRDLYVYEKQAPPGYAILGDKHFREQRIIPTENSFVLGKMMS